MEEPLLNELPRVPDFRSLGKHQEGFATEIGSSDADRIKQAIEAAQTKPVESVEAKTRPIVHTVAGYTLSKPLSDTSHIGWTSFSSLPNPGGTLKVAATEKRDKEQKELWSDDVIIYVVGIGFYIMVQLGASGIITFMIGLLFIVSYYQIYQERFRQRAKDDIQREINQLSLEMIEGAEWLNRFLQKLWLIFEPVLSTYVIENLDTYLVDYLPNFLDSVRLSTFTLGSKPFVIEKVHTFMNTGPDTVCMDWTVSFQPDSTVGMTKEELEQKVNPKIVLHIRLGKGFMGTAFPVLVENMSFRGRMRIKLQLMSKAPHVKIAQFCFMEKPVFDYVLKPIGGETFGFDVNNIPGLQSFVRDQAHAILGPMLYYPNVFEFDAEKFFSGELDISRANGVLAITVHSCSKIATNDASINPFVRFYLDDAQQELEKTSICEDTRYPHWNETKFLLLHDLKSILTMELRTTNNIKKAGKRLARAYFDLKEVERAPELELNGLEIPMLRHGKFVANLKADVKYFSVSKPIENADGALIEPEPSNSGILRVTVHECRNLGSTNKMNPYAAIKINGVDRFQTPTFKHTTNPKFERSFEILVLDKTEVHINVGLIDNLNQVLLGQWSAYLMDIFKQQDEREYWWNLVRDTKEIKARLRLSVQWRPVVMTGLSKMGGASGFYTSPVGVIRLSLWSATYGDNLKRDPYVRIKSGSQVRARTETLDRTVSPEWGEFHYIPIHSIREDLVLELMESTDTKDKTLGSTLLQLKELIQQQKGDIIGYESLVEKLEKDAPLNDQKNAKLRYSAEFYPTLNPAIHKGTRYTPDDIVDLVSYSTGVLTVKIHELKLNKPFEVYCQLLVDSLLPQYKTSIRKGKVLTFGETSDAFIKDVGFSRIAVEVKPSDKTESDESKIGYWYESSERIVRSIQKRIRNGQSFEEDEGVWYDLIGGAGQIRLSFDYTPLLNYRMNPDESLENQGNLTVTLISAKNLKAADKSGTSDPYVKFTVNGEVVHKSATIKKTINPIWKGETFQVPIVSRVTASFRIEVFDWNQMSGDVPLGSGGISLRGDRVESFFAREWDIPLDGVEGVDRSSVRIRLKWEPQLLVRKRTHTTFMKTAIQRVTTKMGTTAFNWSQQLPRSVSVPNKINMEIVEARGLTGEKDEDGTKLNPVVIISIDNTLVFKTRKAKKTGQPVWHEHVCLNQLSGEKVLEIKVKDVHTFHSADIGTYRSTMKEFMSISAQPDRWLPLEPQGEIRVKLENA
ncbi:uncharacterized protein RHIMIDRAFT_313919 [Rhizopus microsporus ATCC 52813]|uniref:Tricalbin n=1 Tax=Rhizopus microsporus ATCC 52813 TaxID=1340429 RepID=A0A2G4SSH7_RHIZD|nr:uncharacterized protein RHIMIDRAFT_313919 [Rhizopus microsporus ATCC 52813]PHZ11710.1 hypothetical protein RHIMIDRAFT_313919 [Rhizopus microsporus ATCC 52813]